MPCESRSLTPRWRTRVHTPAWLLGLAYLGAVLLQAGHEVRALDFNLSGLNLRRIENLVQHDPPQLVGISAHTETYPNGLAIARKIKELDPAIKVVMGGPHPSILPKEVLAEETVDFVVAGEGEATMVELVRRLETAAGRFEAGPSSLASNRARRASWIR
ncbi:MAG: B12-binding domain-containing radical SAM protein [Chitinophagales bacterium]